MKTHIVRTLAVAFAAVLLIAPVALAGDADKVVGVWKAVASTPEGDMPSVLTISQADGELEAKMELAGMERRVTNEALDGDVFKMTVYYDGMPYDVELTVDGDTMEGSWSGDDASGTLKATREP